MRPAAEWRSYDACVPLAPRGADGRVELIPNKNRWAGLAPGPPAYPL